jgi:hypothetical protein
VRVAVVAHCGRASASATRTVARDGAIDGSTHFARSIANLASSIDRDFSIDASIEPSACAQTVRTRIRPTARARRTAALD